MTIWGKDHKYGKCDRAYILVENAKIQFSYLKQDNNMDKMYVYFYYDTD